MKKRRRILLAFMVGTLLVFGGGFLILHAVDDILPDLLRDRIVAAVADSTGLTVVPGEIGIGLLPPEIELRDLRVERDGRRVGGIAELRCRLRWLPLIRRTLHITDLTIREPTLEFDTEDFQGSIGSSGDWTIQIDRFDLNDGRVRVRDRRSGWELAIENLRLQSAAFLDPGGMSGELDASGMEITIGEVRAGPATSRGRFLWSAGRLHLEEWEILIDPALRAAFAADLEPGDDSKPFSYQVNARVEIRTGTLLGSVPALTDLPLDGPMSWEGEITGTGGDFRLQGRLSSPLLDFRKIPLAGLDGDLVVTQDSAVLENLRAGLWGGHLQAGVRLQESNGGWVLGGSAGVEHLRPGDLPLPLPWSDHSARLGSRLGATVQVRVPVHDPFGGEGALDLRLVPDPGAAQTEWLRPEGELHGELRDGKIRLRNGEIDFVGANLRVWDGHLWPDPIDLPFELAIPDLDHTWTELTPHLPFHRVLDRWRPAGAIGISGTARGTPARPQVTARVQGEGMSVAGRPIGSLGAELGFDQNLLKLEDLSIHGPHLEASLHGEGSPFQPADLRLEWILDRLDLGLFPVPSGWPVPSGEITGRGNLVWNDGGPALRGEFHGTGIRFNGVSMGRVELAGGLTPAGIDLDRFTLLVGTGRLSAAGFLPWSGTEGAIRIEAGDLPIDDPTGAGRWSGRLDLNGKLTGGLRGLRPAESTTFRLRSLTAIGSDPIDIDGGVAAVGDHLVVGFRSPQPRLEGSVTLPLEPGGRVRAELAVDRFGLPLPPASADPAARLEAAGIRFTAEGAATGLEAIEYRIGIAETALSSGDWTVRSAAPAVIRGRGRSVRLEPLKLDLDGREFTLEGEGDIADPPVLALRLQGESDLRLIQPLVDGSRMEGRATMEIGVRSRGAAIDLSGFLNIEGGYLKLSEFPHSLEDVNARIDFRGDRVILTGAEGRLGNGLLRGHGELTVGPDGLQAYRLELEGEGITLKVPADFESQSNVRLVLMEVEGTPRLSGRIDVLRGRFSRDFHFESQLLARSRARIVRTAPAGILDRLQLDIRLSADDRVWIENDFARAEFGADFRLGGTAARPLVLGTLELRQPGQVEFREVKYDLTGAVLVYTVAAPNDPELDMRAATEVGIYTVNLTVTGRLSAPRLTLTSEPELPVEQIVALLLTGKTWSQGDTQVSSEYALYYLAGALAPVTAALERATGFEVGIDPVLVEGQGDPTARVTVGRQFGERLWGAYSTALGRSERDVSEIRYKLLPRLQLRQAHEDSGLNIFEARYVRSFRTGGKPPEPGGGRPDDKPVVIDRVLLEGVPDPPGETAFRKAVAIDAGDRLEPVDLMLGGIRGRRLLARNDHPLATVRCAPAAPASGTDPLPVTCRVAAGPRIGLGLHGVKGKQERRVRDAVLEEWETVASTRDLVPAAEAAALSSLFDHGLARATVSGRREQTPAAEDFISLDIVPGPHVRCGSVILAGAEAIPVRELLENLDTTRRIAARKPILTPAILERDRDTLLRLYYGSGFLDVEIPPAEVRYPGSPDLAEITFSIREGERSRLGEIAFVGNHHFSTPDLRDRAGIDTGGYPEPEMLERFAERLQADYDGEGFPDAGVSWWLEPAGEAARAVFEIREGPRIDIGRIRIEGNLLTRDEIIRREIAIREGQPFRRQDLNESQRRIRDLGLFRSVIVRGETRPEQDARRDVVIRVEEKLNLDLAIGLGFDNEEGARGSFSIGNQNIRGTNTSASLQLRYSGLDRTAQAIAGQKRVFGSRYDFLTTIGFREEEREDFTVDRFGTSFQLSRPLGRFGRGKYRYRIQDVSLKDLSIPLEDTGENEGILANVGFAYGRDRRSDPMNPRGGSFTGLDWDVYSALVGSEADFTRVFTQYSRFWPIGNRPLVFGTAVRVGSHWPFADTEQVPVSERFLAGGVTTVRGYGRDSLGPRNPVTGDPVGGDAVMVLNQELRAPLGSLLEGIVFVDSGEVFRRPADLDPLDLKWTAGIGLGLSTPVGPFRFYYGWKLNRAAGDPETGQFNFMFGPTF